MKFPPAFVICDIQLRVVLDQDAETSRVTAVDDAVVDRREALGVTIIWGSAEVQQQLKEHEKVTALSHW